MGARILCAKISRGRRPARDLGRGRMNCTWVKAMRILVGALAVVAAAIALVAGATRRFHRESDDEARALVAEARGAPDRFVDAHELEKLPPPVRRWLAVSGVVGHARAVTVRLKQRGELRTAPDKAWMPVEAAQVFSVDPPGFVWSVDARMMGALPIAGRDHFVAGQGRMLIKLASLFPVADAAGPEIDQGAMLRYLGEIVWFPSAALSDTISWEPIDARRARATMRFAGRSVSAVFAFDDRGRFASLTAQRYMDGGGGRDARLETWSIPATEWRRFCGVEVPVRGTVTWKLASGDFDYYRWEILDVQINPSHPTIPTGEAHQ